jgi:hypothetical protein
MLADTDRAIAALHAIPPTIDHDTRARVGMAAKDAGVTFDDYDAWQATNPRYNAAEVRSMWNSYKEGPVKAGTLFKVAAEHGYRMNGAKPQRRAIQAPSKPIEPPRKPAPGMSAAEVWERCEPATHGHPYIVKKGGAGVPLDCLRVLPADDSLVMLSERMAGALVVPVMQPDGALSSLQFIAPPDVAERLKAKGMSDKPNLLGHSLGGGRFVVGELVPGGVVYICEGLGTAWACWQASYATPNAAAVVCFGSGRVRAVAAELRQRDATARLVLVPDVGKESDAQKIALEVGALVAYMPEGEVNNFDANDLAQRDGGDVLAALLEAATKPAPPPLPLSVAFADELPEAFTPPDELVEGVLTAGDGSVWYGDSNTGKTFVLVDLAASVARGVPWMGKRTEPGLVVYLAAESPASVRSRLQAYQKHYGVRVPNFAIVQSPIDLFDGEADTDKVIEVVRQLEHQRGMKARLIIGDTLARLSAGANENAGQDMGLVVRRFDRIRSECKTHFALIHHSGKSAAAGARGWSGVRAAVDTEIELTDTPAGQCIEIMKQRDLSTKGERIGFKLEPVTLGLSKWGEPATSCVVAAADAPVKQVAKRMGECDGAVLEFLVAHKVGIKKVNVVTHFKGRYASGPIYRSMKQLVTAGAIHEAAGMVCAAGVAK